VLDDNSLSLLESPFTSTTGNDTLADSTLATSEWGKSDWLGISSSLELSVTESLNGGLELVISVEVSWEAGWVKLLFEEWLEAVDNESALEASVRSED
jgi:hypothetical protein